eukprot:scaffold220935_cov20-Prasinocladus_malaysianus.AAC.1
MRVAKYAVRKMVSCCAWHGMACILQHEEGSFRRGDKMLVGGLAMNNLQPIRLWRHSADVHTTAAAAVTKAGFARSSSDQLIVLSRRSWTAGLMCKTIRLTQRHATQSHAHTPAAELKVRVPLRVRYQYSLWKSLTYGGTSQAHHECPYSSKSCMPQY